MSVNSEASGARRRSARKRWWIWPTVALVLLGALGWGIGSKVGDGLADERFVSALRADDDQSWLQSMTDAQLAASGRAECESMRSGDDPQARIDFYTDFNAAYLINDAMRYLCPEQLQR